MIVMKFGGSSVESAKAVQRVAYLVRDRSEFSPVVVVSAMGKTTDRLLSIASLCAAGNSHEAARGLAKLRQFHLTEAASVARASEAVALCRAIGGLFDELAVVLGEIADCGSLTPQLSDAAASFGERLSSLIVTAGFRKAGIDAVHLDARDVIVTRRTAHTGRTPFHRNQRPAPAPGFEGTGYRDGRLHRLHRARGYHHTGPRRLSGLRLPPTKSRSGPTWTGC